MKKITTILLVVLLTLTCITMFACNKFDAEAAQEALNSYIFTQEDSVVYGEFVLPGTIGGFEATWTSSNNDIVALTLIPADEENGVERQYAVKVNYPEEETDVILTVALSDEVKKQYRVTVLPLTVDDIADAYIFEYNAATVVEDFALDQSFTYEGKTATIAWSVEENQEYISISEDGLTCLVNATSLNPTVKIYATFTYDGEETRKQYKVTVSDPKEHLQEVDYWYSNSGVGMPMKGYVVEIATVWSEQYSNVSLYIVDEDFCAGYYLYRVSCDAATAKLLVPGAPVIVTGTTNTIYNGLYETNSNGNVVIDEEREAIDLKTTVHAIDEEIIGGLKSALYHQSSLVSLTNWKVTEINTPSAASSTETMFVLSKGGVEVPIIVSKYHEGSYKREANDAVWTALCNHGVKVGDIVSITGILSNYNGHQIAVRSMADIVVGGTEDPANTVYPGKTAASAIAQIDAALKAAGTDNIISVGKTITLPTVEGVEISARVVGGSKALSIVDGAIVVAPASLESGCVRIDVKVGNFSTVIFRYIESADLDDAGKLTMERTAFELDVNQIVRNSTIELPTSGAIFGDINIAWSFKAETAHDCATLEGNALTVELPKEATTITLVATFSLGEAESLTKEFHISVAKAEAKVLVTVDALNLVFEKYQDGEAVVDGVNFSFTELGDYGYGIQMRNKSGEGGKQSIIGNTNAIGTGIQKIVIKLNAGKSTYDNTDAFAFRFGTSASDLTGEVVMLSTVKGKYEYTVAPETSATFTFFSMEDALTYSFYIDSISIYYSGEITPAHAHNYVWTDLGDGTCSAVCSGDNTHTLPAEAHSDANLDAQCDRCSATVTLPETIDAPAEGAYKMYLVQAKLSKTLYFTDELNDSEYFVTTENASDAVVVTIAKVGEGYTIKAGDKFVEIYTNSNSKVRPTLVDASTGTWAWDQYAGVFTWDVAGTLYYLGTYNEFNTISASKTSYITGDNLSAIGVSQFVCQYEAVVAEPECEHEFDNTCDNECNLCGDPNPNFADHVDADPEDCVCDVCEAALEHKDENSDFVCDICETSLCNHAFDNNCDNECNNCGAANPNFADHVDAAEADCVCDVCSAPIDHTWANACDTACDVCGETRTPEDHVYTHNGDASCNVCGETRTIAAPVNQVTGADLSTIPAILEIGAAKDHNTYTTDKYLVIGYVDDVYQTTYGNMHIVDENGNILTVYGTYNNDGTTRYDALTVKPVAGDVVVIYGVVGQFNGTPQIKNGWIMQINDTVLGNVHSVCTEFSDATCTEPAKCLVCGKENGEALGHTDTDEPKCVCDVCEATLAHVDEDEDNVCDVCEAALGGVAAVPAFAASISFSDGANRTAYSTSEQVWEQNGIKVTNNKASSTSNVGDYTNPARFYKSSNLTVEYTGIVKIVFHCNSNSYATALQSSITAGEYTVEVNGKDVTVTFNNAVDSFEIASLTGGQVRMDSIDVWTLQ